MAAAPISPVVTLRVHAFIRARNRLQFTIPELLQWCAGLFENEVRAYLRRLMELGVVRGDAHIGRGKQGHTAHYWQHAPLPRTTRHPPMSQWAALDRVVRAIPASPKCSHMEE